MRIFLTFSIAFGLTFTVSTLLAQKSKTDTATHLQEVIIRPYFSPVSLQRATGSVGIADTTVLDKQPSTSLVSTLNTLSGVRMEERSPGSYRLSIRGSLLRSPFGVRNVKIYFDDFPLTDAGGNSYLNALDVSGTTALQVLKGPQSSIFGANSGGVVLVQPTGSTGFGQPGQPGSTLAQFSAEGGSYGTFRESAFLNQQYRRYRFNITQAYQRSDGYREHSAMDRKYLQTFQQFDYATNASLKALLFYSDLHYNTPGGLTAAQFTANPQASRPSTPATRSAIEQRAGIYSKTFYAGLSNNWAISEHFRHVLSVYGSYTDFKNPFITNYEHRMETTLGLRSYLEYALQTTNARWKVNAGLESMTTGTGFNNYDNNFGTPAAVQATDKLHADASFGFLQLTADLYDKLLIELSASLNLYGYDYKSTAPVAIARKTVAFDTQLMPRAAVSYLISNAFSLRASASKGYSPPTLAEVRASNNVINTSLQPEYGWSYETGFRLQTMDGRFFADLNGFHYQLRDAIVRRLDQADREYFINAGGTSQWGLETGMSYQLLPLRGQGIVRGFLLRNAYTLSRFRFGDYVSGNNDYSGNALTGVPRTVVVSSAELQLPHAVYVFFQHNYTSSIPLNDANSVYARKYHLLQARIGWKNLRIGTTTLELFAGGDNLLNQTYSLGNDLNAVGNRYFNAAAKRNFYGGLAVKFRK
ncbi:TonB-dependent receptor [Pedobacter sp. JY14-1]|uniref:TonB-dependent receptor n=1 Tax=Pedobacter sp. JY14-1 TaxID=3034151 RepID=UPI0023E1A1D0|nr:TonB-dependent receptor [Pedobacter sp. JY14-1]